jgi:hypothetical protein
MQINTVADAILALDGQCDHASSLDGVGFSKFDAEFGKSMASGIRQFGHLSRKQFPYAQKLVKKYRKQVAALGGDVEKLLAETLPAAPVKEEKPMARVNVLVKSGAETAAAILVRASEMAPDVWLPRSQIMSKEQSGEGKWLRSYCYIPMVVTIPLWLANAKGLSVQPVAKELEVA